jgi:hypothetical protein
MAPPQCGAVVICDIRLIPTPVGWGVFCKTHDYRTGPFQQKPKAEAAAEAHRKSVQQATR